MTPGELATIRASVSVQAQKKGSFSFSRQSLPFTCARAFTVARRTRAISFKPTARLNALRRRLLLTCDLP
jgi:hypothetical protein